MGIRLIQEHEAKRDQLNHCFSDLRVLNEVQTRHSSSVRVPVQPAASKPTKAAQSAQPSLGRRVGQRNTGH